MRRRSIMLGLVATTILAAGCTADLRGSPAVDPAVASSLAAARALTTPPNATGSTSRIHTPTTSTPPTTRTTHRSSTKPPTRPTPFSTPASATRATTPTGSTTTHTGTARTVETVVHGIPVGAIVAELPDNPVYVEADFQGDAGEMADLRDQVRTARTSGLNIWVVLLGHDVGGLTDVSDAIATGAGGTAVVVATKSVSVSSSRFSSQQLRRAEHRVGKGASGVQAASVLVDQFRSMAAGGPTTAPKTTTTPRSTTAPKTAGTSARQVGPILSLRSFQLADHSIGCLISGGAVRCDVMVKHSYSPPKNPHPRCEGDYGSSIRMPPGGPAAFACVSDTAYDPHAPVLRDGETTRVGHVMCTAAGSTVTCMDVDSDHGFVISPRVYSLF